MIRKSLTLVNFMVDYTLKRFDLGNIINMFKWMNFIKIMGLTINIHLQPNLLRSSCSAPTTI